ncbi:MAG: heavy metal-associated domain-containing protein [Campylobacterota bacterium]
MARVILILSLFAVFVGAREWTLRITGMHCIACTLAVKKALMGIPGVRSAKVSFKNETALVDAQENVTLETMQNAVARTGYTITSAASK